MEHNRDVNCAQNEIVNAQSNLFENFSIKVSKKKWKEIYDDDNLLDINNIIPKESIRKLINSNIQNISGNIINSMIMESNHFNIILLGKTGIGKSTLINSILKLEDNKKAKEGYGFSTTKHFEEYISNERPGLRLIDSRGIEIGKYNIDELLKSVIKYIEDISKEGNSDKFIHCIWYCIDSNCTRLEKEEEDIVKKLKGIYDEQKLPIIFVLTKCFNETEYKKMITLLKDLGINDIITVIAKDYEIKSKKYHIVAKKKI